MVEMAIALPLLLLLVFGIIEFGIAWFDNHSISQGVRETARRGIVLDFDGDVSACAGQPTAGEQLACQAGHVIGVDGAGVRVESTGTEQGDEISVCAAVTYDALTGLLNPFLDGRVLASSAEMRLEQDAPPGTNLSGTWGDASDVPATEDCP